MRKKEEAGRKKEEGRKSEGRRRKRNRRRRRENRRAKQQGQGQNQPHNVRRRHLSLIKLTNMKNKHRNITEPSKTVWRKAGNRRKTEERTRAEQKRRSKTAGAELTTQS